MADTDTAIPKLNGAQIKELKETFKQFDQNNDGVISLMELREVMGSMKLRPSDEELQQMIKDVDRNENGTIEFEEFVVLMSSPLKTDEDHETQDRELHDAFAHFDLDGSGTISKKELKIAMANLGDDMTPEQIRVTMNTYDLNGDGEIDFQEFKVMMRGETRPQPNTSTSLSRRGSKSRPPWRP
ncbi:calmodulin [Jimgerdemannia flammicorona]|uniref:Calmodulin n=2 Tax=Jimgerdemannia flammicorona TaxID=994334 RepID=A0A433CXT6_9FUNG|nr:calmodulin [Jimgerdemannia flammicorona]RUS23796.1 calmodulin [Jimgerdemannia flammicorona]